MKYLLDTVVISEYIRKRPIQSVLDWLDEQNEQSLFLSILTIAELKKGYYKLAEGNVDSGQPDRAKKILHWIDRVERRFDGRVLPMDADLLNLWVKICGAAESSGRSLPVFDSLLTATALRYQLVLVTRNITDFANCSKTLEIFNPYDTDD